MCVARHFAFFRILYDCSLASRVAADAADDYTSDDIDDYDNYEDDEAAFTDDDEPALAHSAAVSESTTADEPTLPLTTQTSTTLASVVAIASRFAEPEPSLETAPGKCHM